MQMGASGDGREQPGGELFAGPRWANPFVLALTRSGIGLHAFPCHLFAQVLSVPRHRSPLLWPQTKLLIERTDEQRPAIE
jgi:hypothetical protein